MSAEDWLALRRLAVRYAQAVDRRDVERFLSVFAEDATLSVFSCADDPEPRSRRTGHQELAAIPGALERYAGTTHLLGQSDYEIEGATGRGEVYCVAHPLTLGPETTDRVLYLRYQDNYRRDAAERWMIQQRRVLIDRAELRPIALVE